MLAFQEELCSMELASKTVLGWVCSSDVRDIKGLQNFGETAFHPDSAWKRSPKTCMKLTSAECTVENS